MFYCYTAGADPAERNDMQIRYAEERDIDDILRLLVQVNMVHHTIRPDLFKGPATKYSREELAAMLHLEDDPIFVCTDDDDRMLRYIFCQTEIVEESPLRTGIRSLYIDDLCVDEKRRGQHIGRMLTDYVTHFAREKGCYDITLNVWEGNDQALNFYRRNGFGVRKTVMEKIL